MGVYENTVDGLFTNYVVPQSNGNHIDCKWIFLTDDREMGSYSCGQWQLEMYRVKNEAFGIRVRLTAFNNKERADMVIGREKLCVSLPENI